MDNLKVFAEDWKDWIPEGVTTKTVLLTSSALLAFAWLLKRRRHNVPPGPTPLPIVGSLHHLIKRKNAHLVFYEWHKQYGNVYMVKIGAFNTVILCSHDIVKEAYVNKADIFSNRPDYLYIPKIINNYKGIVWDSHWREIRRFTLTALKDFGVGKKSLEERVQDEVNYLCDKMDALEGTPVKIQPLLSKSFANVICTVIFGKRFDFEDPSFIKITSVIDEVFKKGGFGVNYIDFIPLFRYLPGVGSTIRRLTNRRDGIEKYVYDAIEEHRATFDPANIRDFIDLYLETEQQDQNREYLTRYTLMRIVVELFLAGTDTSSTTMSWALLLMMAHPDVQGKCREEIKKVVGSRSPDSKDRSKLPYVDATLMEIQRFSNIAPMSLPHVTSEDTEIGGYSIAKGTMVYALLYSVHHDKTVWPDHDQFRPERWIGQDGQLDAKQLPFVPFSLGRRQCLGEQLARMEMFLFFANLIQRYEFERVHPKTPTSLESQMGITLYPVDGTIKYKRV